MKIIKFIKTTLLISMLFIPFFLIDIKKNSVINHTNKNFQLKIPEHVNSSVMKQRDYIIKISESFRKFVNKSTAKGGNALLSLYQSLPGNTVSNKENAIFLNQNNGVDLLLKLSNTNKQFLNQSREFKIIINSQYWDEIGASDLYFLSILTNLNSLVLSSNNISKNNELLIKDMNDFNWVNNLSALTEFKLVSQSGNVKGPLELSNFLKSRKLKKVDLSEFVYLDKGVSKSIISNLKINEKWYKNKLKNFEILLPSFFDLMTLNEKPNSITKQISTSKYTSILKMIEPSININSSLIKQIYIDNIVYNKTILNSEFIWTIPIEKLENAEYLDPKTGHYYSTKTDNNFQKISKISLDNAYKTKRDTWLAESNNSFAKIFKNIDFYIGDLSNSDINNKLKTSIVIDSQNYPAFLNGNNYYYKFNPKIIKFGGINIYDGQYRFWTNIDKISSTDLENFKINEYKSFSTLDNWLDIFKNNVLKLKNSEDENIIFDSISNITPYYDIINKNFNWPINIYEKLFTNISNQSFKYYSSTLNEIYTSTSEIIRNGRQLNEFIELNTNSLAKYDSTIFFDATIVLSPISGIKNIRNFIFNHKIEDRKIKIDNEFIDSILWNNNIIYDANLREIKYCITNSEGDKEYYTSYAKIPNPNNPSLKIAFYKNWDNKKYSLPELVKPSLSSEKDQVDHITLNGKIIPYFLGNGKLGWNVDGKFTNSINQDNIKYVDINGNYFFGTLQNIYNNFNNELGGSEQASLPKGLTSIVKPKKLVYDKELYNSKILEPILTKDNARFILEHNYIKINSVTYKRRIENSGISWISENGVPADLEKIKYEVAHNNDGKINELGIFYTNLTYASRYSNNFPKNLIRLIKPNNINKFSLLPTNQLKKPKSLVDSLTIHLANGGTITTLPEEKKNKAGNIELIWSKNSNSIIQKIKFSNELPSGKIEYYVSILNKDISNLNKVSDVIIPELKLEPEIDTSQETNLSKKDVLNEKSLVLYIVFGIFGVLITILTFTIMIKLFKKK